jgi:hypothetical protein
VPLLTDVHKSNRIKWCKEQNKLKLDGVFFSDETYIEVGTQKEVCGIKGKSAEGRKSEGTYYSLTPAIKYIFNYQHHTQFQQELL